MDVREKLIEILKQAPFEWRVLDEWWFEEKISRIADHLIRNGVTVQELDGCEHCLTASYTEKPFIVITQMGREVKTKFNFCPHCGRRLPQTTKGE